MLDLKNILIGQGCECMHQFVANELSRGGNFIAVFTVYRRTRTLRRKVGVGAGLPVYGILILNGSPSLHLTSEPKRSMCILGAAVIKLIHIMINLYDISYIYPICDLAVLFCIYTFRIQSMPKVR